MDDITLAHFTYWLQEHTDFRGIRNHQTPQDKMHKILELKKEFFTKYPGGRLRGFQSDITPFI